MQHICGHVHRSNYSLFLWNMCRLFWGVDWKETFFHPDVENHLCVTQREPQPCSENGNKQPATHATAFHPLSCGTKKPSSASQGFKVLFAWHWVNPSPPVRQPVFSLGATCWNLFRWITHIVCPTQPSFPRTSVSGLPISKREHKPEKLRETQSHNGSLRLLFPRMENEINLKKQSSGPPSAQSDCFLDSSQPAPSPLTIIVALCQTWPETSSPIEICVEGLRHKAAKSTPTDEHPRGRLGPLRRVARIHPQLVRTRQIQKLDTTRQLTYRSN